jgi:hypothetical protein
VPVESMTAKRVPALLFAVPSLVTTRQVPLMTPVPSADTWGSVSPDKAMVAARSVTLSLPSAVVEPRPSVLGVLALPLKTVVSFSVAELAPNVATEAPLIPRAVPLPPWSPLRTQKLVMLWKHSGGRSLT